MRLEFLGTRGYIDAKSEKHTHHSSMLVVCGDTRLMIDAGEDWRGRLEGIGPDAIVVTHAHPDHVFGLKDGAPCPVYASAETWERIDRYPLEERHSLAMRTRRSIGSLSVKPYRVEHSTRAPAVGYRIESDDLAVFYVPDVVYIEERGEALAGCRLYVGDGATVSRTMVRKPRDTLIGHTPIRTQLTWCAKEGVPDAVFTHCGSEIVKGDEAEAAGRVREYAEERGVGAGIAYDGLVVDLDRHEP